mgnify:CR=1 FL=1
MEIDLVSSSRISNCYRLESGGVAIYPSAKFLSVCTSCVKSYVLGLGRFAQKYGAGATDDDDVATVGEGETASGRPFGGVGVPQGVERRDVLKSGISLAAIAGVAGCLSGGDSEATTTTAADDGGDSETTGETTESGGSDGGTTNVFHELQVVDADELSTSATNSSDGVSVTVDGGTPTGPMRIAVAASGDGNGSGDPIVDATVSVGETVVGTTDSAGLFRTTQPMTAGTVTVETQAGVTVTVDIP